MSKYQAIAADIRNKILETTYASGQKLPTIPELCSTYGVSKITVKRAMDDLEQEGLVVRRRGSGTYVTHAQTRPVSQAQRVFDYSFEVHEFAVQHPSPAIADQLLVGSDGFVFKICRMALSKGSPCFVERVYLPLTLAPNLRASDAKGSLCRYLEDETGLRIASVHQVVAATHPSERATRDLGIGQTTPVLRECDTYYASDGQTLMLTDKHFVPGFELSSVRPYRED